MGQESTELEVLFEVGGPDGIGLVLGAKAVGEASRSWPTTLGPHQPFPTQNVPDDARRSRVLR